MRKETSNRSGLLLMEIIIAILFFSVISALCLQVFVKSHTISRDTQALDGAVNQASSVAELLSSGTDPREKEGDNLYYTEDYAPCDESDAFYYLEIIADESDEQTTDYTLTMFQKDSGSLIYTMHITVYQPLTM